MNKIYLAGKITGDNDYYLKFLKKETHFRNMEKVVLNPAMLPEGMRHEDYMHICLPMIDVADKVYFMSDWVESKGAKMEHDYCIARGKLIEYEVPR